MAFDKTTSSRMKWRRCPVESRAMTFDAVLFDIKQANSDSKDHSDITIFRLGRARNKPPVFLRNTKSKRQ